jgi:carbon-monoxide dehydrogenase medium subunit
MYQWQEYRQPKSIAEAIEDLSTAPKPAVPIAGGTDLLLDMRQGRYPSVHTLIDLTGIPEMNSIETRGGSLFIGACAPINRIINDPLVQRNAQALIEACNLIAGPQVRNIATLGGNVAHALPAADGTIALVALNASAFIAHPGGVRQMQFHDLFLGPGKTSINKLTELIIGFSVPVAKLGQASAFKRIMRPQGVALPILNCAVWVEREVNKIVDVRIAVGPGGPTPFRATNAEDFIIGQDFTEENLSGAKDALLEQGSFRTSPRRATSEYRKRILPGLFCDTFKEAWLRARDN